MTGLQIITKAIYADRLKNKLTLVRCEVPKGVKDSKNGKKLKKNQVDFDCVLQIKTLMAMCPPCVVSLNLKLSIAKVWSFAFEACSMVT